MKYRVITDAQKLKGMRVLVRVDYNVPVKKGKILDNTKIKASLKTLRYLIKQQARIILISHLGRPEGKKDAQYSLKPIASVLEKLLHRSVTFLPANHGKDVTKHIDKMHNGEICLLENIRFEKDEKNQNGILAQQLSQLGDIFVLDGFGVAHRPDASVTGIMTYLPSYAGILFDTEVQSLKAVLEKPAMPLCVVIGGIKMETKIPVIQSFAKKATHILIGGGIVNTYLHAKGFEIGASIIDADCLAVAKKYLSVKNVQIPVDVIVGTADGKNVRTVSLTSKKVCASHEAIFDIGPQTRALYGAYIDDAQSIVYNGAMGYFEKSPYDRGTQFVTKKIITAASRGAYAVIGGGETVEIVQKMRGKSALALISTGGGAMLEFLAYGTLPALNALEKNARIKNSI